MQLDPREQFLKKMRLDNGVAKVEPSDRLAQERRLAGLHFDHYRTKLRRRKLERNRRRSSARANVDHEPITRPNEPRTGQRLDDQPVDSVIGRRIDREGREINLPIPLREDCQVRVERLDKRG